MPDMIFPTQQISETNEEYLGKVQTLNADFIASRLASLREAGDSSKMPAELLEHFKSKRGEDSESKEQEEETSEESPEEEKEEDETDPEFIKKALNEMDSIIAGNAEPCACGSKGCPECNGGEERSASTESRKVVFTDADLTAEAVQRDIQAGNMEMAQARLAARQMRRERLAERVASSAKAEAEKSQRLAQRSEFRKSVVAEVEAAQTRAASVEAPKATYKSASQMNLTERQIIAQRLAASGEFPEEFIEASLSEDAIERSAEEKAGREILASTLSESAKSLALRQIVAKLSPESRNRALEYWTKDLPYGDKEWVKDLWSSKYD